MIQEARQIRSQYRKPWSPNNDTRKVLDKIIEDVCKPKPKLKPTPAPAAVPAPAPTWWSKLCDGVERFGQLFDPVELSPYEWDPMWTPRGQGRLPSLGPIRGGVRVRILIFP
jgi:hypothetical protein